MVAFNFTLFSFCVLKVSGHAVRRTSRAKNATWLRWASQTASHSQKRRHDMRASSAKTFALCVCVLFHPSHCVHFYRLVVISSIGYNIKYRYCWLLGSRAEPLFICTEPILKVNSKSNTQNDNSWHIKLSTKKEQKQTLHDRVRSSRSSKNCIHATQFFATYKYQLFVVCVAAWLFRLDIFSGIVMSWRPCRCSKMWCKHACVLKSIHQSGAMHAHHIGGTPKTHTTSHHMCRSSKHTPQTHTLCFSLSRHTIRVKLRATRNHFFKRFDHEKRTKWKKAL